MSLITRKISNGRTTDELMALLSAVGCSILAALFIAALYFGREIFVPISLAILLSFVLGPSVGLLQRARVPRGLAVVGIVFLAFSVIFGLGTLIANQLSQLAGDLPVYQSTMQEKIKSVRGVTASSGTLERAADMLQELSRELDRPKDDKSARGATSRLGAPNAGGTTQPIPVEVRQPDPGALENLRTLIAPLLNPLATTGIIIIFVIFILIQREDLRNRLIRLAGSHDLQRTTAALDDAALEQLLKGADSRWAAAGIGSMSVSDLELKTGTSLMAIGGFTGGDPSPTLAQFQQYVADGQVRYFLADSGRGGPFGHREGGRRRQRENERNGAGEESGSGMHAPSCSAPGPKRRRNPGVSGAAGQLFGSRACRSGVAIATLVV